MRDSEQLGPDSERPVPDSPQPVPGQRQPARDRQQPGKVGHHRHEHRIEEAVGHALGHGGEGFRVRVCPTSVVLLVERRPCSEQ